MANYRPWVLLVLIASTTAARAAGQPARPATPLHPLDPLTGAEILAAVAAVQQDPNVPPHALYPSIALNEPAKDEVRGFKPGASFRREAFLVILDRPSGRTFEAVVDLRTKAVVSMNRIDGVQPSITFEELDAVPKLVRAHPEWQAAIRRRGVTNVEEVMVDPWAPGLLDQASEPRTTRWVRALAYLKGKDRNGYARPIEGVVAVVNLTAMRVERVIDAGVVPLPPERGDLDEKSVGPLRAGPKPLRYSLPLGTSFTINGHEIRWQKWRFRVAVHPREGLVLHTVGYEDQGRVRPILHRASLSEMLVPYADPAANWSFRNAFDEGEYGIGRLTNSMEPGTDAPAHARFLDAVFADDFGKPMRVPRAIAVYERDGGVLWKHFEYYSGTNDARRARDLVVSSIVTVGNYDYALNWIFRQDGSLELQALLTGILLAKGVDAAKAAGHTMGDRNEGGTPDHDGTYWHLVAPNVAAPHHQHFFNFRLDLDVDGHAPNAVRELNVRAMPPGPENPARNAFVMEATALETERGAMRDLDLSASRKWFVVNPGSRNALGQPAGYLLIPGESGVPYLQPDSNIRQRAAFIDHHFWATPFAPAEMHAAGDYPNQSQPGEGLAKWTAGNRRLEGEDVVVWYTFAVTHVPRPEEWPVMSAHTAGFKLLPMSFFSKNPALDVPKGR